MKYVLLLLLTIGWSYEAGAQGACNNVTNPGTVGPGQTICAGTQPLPIVDVISPAGGTGALVLDWLRLEQMGSQAPLWVTVPDAEALDYQPDTLYTTQYYMREARRADCPYFLSSNIVSIIVLPADDSLCQLTGVKSIAGTDGSFTVSPNPCREKTTLYNRADTGLTALLFGSDGLILHRITVPANTDLEVETARLPAGMYFLQAARSDGRSWTTKIVKTN